YSRKNFPRNTILRARDSRARFLARPCALEDTPSPARLTRARERPTHGSMPFSLPEPAFLSAACALAAAAGAWAGARACALARLQEEQRATLAAANVSVAALTALLDKL